ncbi:MAG TPA: hypothetical protein PK339_03265 [Flavitalea sp.]|nr:hypothetical protein [Flavitalea sp.]
MRTAILILSFSLMGAASRSQYYYKDQLTTLQTIQQAQQYKQQKIRKIKLLSFESDNLPSEGFLVEQTFNNQYTQASTVTRSPVTGESELKTFYNAQGQLVKTADTTDGASSVTEYVYNSQGRPVKISNASTSAGQHISKETHIWFFDEGVKPKEMLRIKNDTDTTYVQFALDEQGNVTEENSRRNGSSLQPVYYYYDDQNRLTDIVAYNQKARRLLPLYVFEYAPSGLLHSMMVVPEGSDNYQKWIYEYNEQGLKTKETCYNKRKQMLGRIEYKYQ